MLSNILIGHHQFLVKFVVCLSVFPVYQQAMCEDPCLFQFIVVSSEFVQLEDVINFIHPPTYLLIHPQCPEHIKTCAQYLGWNSEKTLEITCSSEGFLGNSIGFSWEV